MSTELVRDSVTGAAVIARHDGHFVTVVDEGVPVLYLSKSAALKLAARLIEATGASA